ncbi:MBL fold metallo-hydrolase, partial [Enterococcus hirae]
ERITTLTLADELMDKAEINVLDVRTEKEWNEGHIKGSKNIPLSQLDERLNEIDSDKETVVTCQSGYRASIAASILEKQNIENISVLVGGMSA